MHDVIVTVVVHIEKEHYEQRVLLELVRGTISNVFDAASRDGGRLDDWLVALSPLMCDGRWHDLALTFAKQLSGEGHHYKAVSYLLAANRTHDAVEMLMKVGQFRDALCVARARLSPLDPIFDELLPKWGQHQARDMNLELAAKW